MPPPWRFVYSRSDPVAVAQDPADEEPWLYEPGGMGDFELCNFDRYSLPVTRLAQPPMSTETLLRQSCESLLK
jgi:hypothetical protein